MDFDTEKIAWHYKTLPNETRRAFDFLSNVEWLERTNWYLAGGTALALQVGHRRSFDLDFFTQDKNFDEKKLLAEFFDNIDWQTEVEEKNTVYGRLFESKISFIAYPFFVPKQKFIRQGSIKVLDKTDIAVMKITAISQRGRKRDFFDLYWCAKNVEPLENIVRRLPEQYPSVAHDYHHVLKSMVYFEDAENDPDPEIYFDANWKKVKSFFKEEIPVIAKSVMKLK